MVLLDLMVVRWLSRWPRACTDPALSLRYPGRIVSALLSLMLLSAPAAAQQAPEPSPDLAAERVVEVQLAALQRNDEPRPDAGIRLAWRFAHPANRKITGPIERFTKMLNSPAYAPLLNHRQHAIEPIRRGDAAAVFRVTVFARDGPVLVYRWSLEKVSEGSLTGSWMTTAVSPPKRRGNAI